MKVIVVGSGPSLTPEIADKIRQVVRFGRGFRVIAVNLAYKLVRLDSICACDGDFWAVHGADVKEFYLCSDLWSANRGAASAFGLRWLDSREHGSGLQAIRLAQQFGAAEVALVGFDWGPVGDKSHFHGDHKPPLRNVLNFDQYTKPDFGKLKIVNCTPGSKLKWYPQGDLQEFLDG